MFEMTGNDELCAKIPQLLIRNHGNEEALFEALSQRCGCTVLPYRHVCLHVVINVLEFKYYLCHSILRNIAL